MDEGGLTLKGYTGCKFVGRGTQGSVFKAYTISFPKTSVAIKVSLRGFLKFIYLFYFFMSRLSPRTVFLKRVVITWSQKLDC